MVDQQSDAASPPPPGWYPDPTDTAQQRYWDGGAWTRHTGHEARSKIEVGSHLDDRATPVTTGERAAFVVTYFLGGLLFGPIAMRYAGRAEGARAAGDRATARAHARRAKIWTVVAFLVGVATVLLVLGYLDVLPTELDAVLP